MEDRPGGRSPRPVVIRWKLPAGPLETPAGIARNRPARALDRLSGHAGAADPWNRPRIASLRPCGPIGFPFASRSGPGIDRPALEALGLGTPSRKRFFQ